MRAKRRIAGALGVLLTVTALWGNVWGTKAEQLQTGKAAVEAKQVERLQPEAAPVKIGKKVKDEEIAVDGITTLDSYAVAGSRKAFIKKLYQYMNARVTNFTIVFNGRYDKIYKNRDIDTIFRPAWNIDKKNTSSDFDYLYGNIAKYEIRIPVYSANRSIFQITITYRESASQLKQVDRAVQNALAGLSLNGKSRVEKIRLIHNYIAETVTYETSYYPSKYTAYYGLVSPQHECVCQGYALIFYKMCTEAGIPCRFVTGKGNGGSGWILHAWNMVKVGGKWYYVDVTWDDPDSIYRPYTYQYFLIGSDTLKKDHILDAEYRSAKFLKKYKIAAKDYKGKQKETAAPAATVRPTTTPLAATATPVTTEPGARPTATPYKTSSPIPTTAPAWSQMPEPTLTPDITETGWTE